MRALDLWNQGGFVVYKKGGEGLDQVYASFSTHPEGKIKARQRIESVEIETALDEVDVARVTFIDAERVWQEYFVELYKSGKLEEDIWTVKIGYHFMPEDTWATFSGVPMIETVEYPRNGLPRVTVRLFSAAVALQRSNSSHAVKSRHWLFGPDEPPQVKRALQEMASYYGLALDLGTKVSHVLDILDEHFRFWDDQTTRYLRKEWSHGPTWPWEHVIAVQLPEYMSALRRLNTMVSTRVAGEPKDMKDWEYLRVVRDAIQPILSEKYQGEKTAGIDDVFWTAVSKACNRIVFGVDGGKLIFKTLGEYIEDLNEIVVFSYQTGDYSLLEFRTTGKLNQAGTGFFSMLSGLFGRRKAQEVTVEDGPAITAVEGGSDSAEMRYQIGPADPNEGDLQSLSGEHFFRLSPASAPEEWTRGANKQVLGLLNTNLTAQATLIGAPFLRAGKLMGTFGLGFSPDSKPDPEQSISLFGLDRVWIITRCTHRVDASGFFTTEVELAGAISDDSPKKIQQIASTLITQKFLGGLEMGAAASDVKAAIQKLLGG